MTKKATMQKLQKDIEQLKFQKLELNNVCKKLELKAGKNIRIKMDKLEKDLERSWIKELDRRTLYLSWLEFFEEKEQKCRDVRKEFIEENDRINEEILENEREIYFLRHGCYNFFIDRDGNKSEIFDEGYYTYKFIEHQHLPFYTFRGKLVCSYDDTVGKYVNDEYIYVGSNCKGDLDSECKSATKIRLDTPVNGTYFNYLYKYMKKTTLERKFDVRIKRKDLIRINDLVVGFFVIRNASDGRALESAPRGAALISPIIDVSKFVKEYEKQLIKKHGQEAYDSLKLPLLFA